MNDVPIVNGEGGAFALAVGVGLDVVVILVLAPTAGDLVAVRLFVFPAT